MTNTPHIDKVFAYSYYVDSLIIIHVGYYQHSLHNYVSIYFIAPTTNISTNPHTTWYHDEFHNLYINLV